MERFLRKTLLMYNSSKILNMYSIFIERYLFKQFFKNVGVNTFIANINFNTYGKVIQYQ